MQHFFCHRPHERVAALFSEYACAVAACTAASSVAAMRFSPASFLHEQTQ